MKSTANHMPHVSSTEKQTSLNRRTNLLNWTWACHHIQYMHAGVS